MQLSVFVDWRVLVVYSPVWTAAVICSCRWQCVPVLLAVTESSCHYRSNWSGEQSTLCQKCVVCTLQLTV